jgi:hypothetical protein
LSLRRLLFAAERSLFTVVSSCGPKQTCFDKTFASVFFDASVQPKEDLPVGCTKEALKSKLRDLLFSDTPHGYKHTCDITKHDGTLERTVEFNKSDLCQKEFTVKLLRTIFKISLDKQWRASKEDAYLALIQCLETILLLPRTSIARRFFPMEQLKKKKVGQFNVWRRRNIVVFLLLCSVFQSKKLCVM